MEEYDKSIKNTSNVRGEVYVKMVYYTKNN